MIEILIKVKIEIKYIDIARYLWCKHSATFATYRKRLAFISTQPTLSALF